MEVHAFTVIESVEITIESARKSRLCDIFQVEPKPTRCRSSVFNGSAILAHSSSKYKVFHVAALLNPACRLSGGSAGL